MIYLELFLGFLKIGFFSFGGAYSAIPLIREVVLNYGWIEEEKLSYMIAVSESTPGPIMVNLATYVGNEKGGILGSIIATLTVILPAFLIVILLTAIFKNFIKKAAVAAVMNGLKSSVIGIILATGFYMALGNIIGSVSAPAFSLTAFIMTVCLALIYFGSRIFYKKGMSPILLIVISAAAGVIVYGW